MRIGILGTGHVAQWLGAAWEKAGHEVVLGSRDPGHRQAVLPVRDLADAVRHADVVVNALPGAIAVETVTSLGAGLFAGTIVLDVSNAMNDVLEPLYLGSVSLAERLQAALPEARVVKSLNTMDMALVVDPGRIAASTVFLSGNDERAKATVAGLVHDLGWSADALVDLGGIETARGAEGHLVMLSALSATLGTRIVNIRVVS